MAKFKRLTDEEARSLTRGELLDRVEREVEYWGRKLKRQMTDEDSEAYREFGRIMHRCIDPVAGIADAIAYVKGEPGVGSYWDEKPGDGGER